MDVLKDIPKPFNLNPRLPAKKSPLVGNEKEQYTILASPASILTL